MRVNERFEKLNREMFENLLKKNPNLATFFGLHEPYDWLLPEGSARNVFDTLELVREWFEKLKEKVK